MKTSQEWMDWIQKETNDPNQKGYTVEVLLTVEAVEAIQKDAFVSGLKRAVEIVSLRTATTKNESYTAAIEEAKVFLDAEIERGGKPAYCVCQSTTTPPTKG